MSICVHVHMCIRMPIHVYMHMSFRPAARMRCAGCIRAARAHANARAHTSHAWIHASHACMRAHACARTHRHAVHSPVQGHVHTGAEQQQQRTVSCEIVFQDSEQMAAICFDAIMVFSQAQQDDTLGHAVSPTPTF